MATPLTATHRIDIPCAVPGLPAHHHRIYCHAVPTTTSDPTGWDLVVFTGGVVGFNAAMTPYILLLRALYDTSVAVGVATLEQFLSGAWIPVVADSNSGVGSESGGPQLAQQTSVNFRTSAINQRCRIQIMEPAASILGYFGKFNGTAGMPTPLFNLVSAYNNHTAPAVGSYAQSRGSAGEFAFFSAVLDQNKRMKRKRGAS